MPDGPQDMSPLRSAIPALRLVNGGEFADAPLGIADHAPLPSDARRVASENRRAAMIGATDTRWVFAVQVARDIDGGRAAVLTPEKRRRLLGIADGLGLRVFDANLVIAIVQDGARSGEGTLSDEVEARLTLVRPSDADRPWAFRPVRLLVPAALLAGAAVWILARWWLG